MIKRNFLNVPANYHTVKMEKIKGLEKRVVYGILNKDRFTPLLKVIMDNYTQDKASLKKNLILIFQEAYRIM